MMYFSEMLNQMFDTPELLEKAEKAKLDKVKAAEEAKAKEKMAREAKAKARAVKAKEVEDALTELQEAQKKYRSKLSEFTKEYGTFHMSLSEKDADRAISSLWDLFFN